MIVFFADLLDPVSILFAIVGMCFARRWWHALVVAVIATFLLQLIFISVSPGAELTNWIGQRFFAALVHALIAYAFVRAVRRKFSRSAQAKTSKRSVS